MHPSPTPTHASNTPPLTQNADVVGMPFTNPCSHTARLALYAPISHTHPRIQYPASHPKCRRGRDAVHKSVFAYRPSRPLCTHLPHPPTHPIPRLSPKMQTW